MNEILLKDTKMKTTVPNKETSNSKGKLAPTTPSISTPVPNSNMITKKDSASKDKANLEKQLDEINRLLGNVNVGKKSESSVKSKAENELNLLEQKILLLVELKQWKDASEDGYKILGKKGPSVPIYRSILVSLCRLGRFEDVVELLEQWNRATPKCGKMLDAKRKMEGYLSAIRSGIDANSLIQNIEDVIKVPSDASTFSKESSPSEPSWNYRPPPQRHNTFSLCSRITSGTACLYGDDCLSAHSKEELKEWQNRILWKNNKLTAITGTGEILKPPTSTTPQQKTVPRESIPLSYRLLPPACMYYLSGLVKRIQETKNLKDLLIDNLPDVKLKFSTPLIVRKKLGTGIELCHKWTFMIASKRPLATATLLHDSARDRFGITGAFFFNSKREVLDLIELHPNNKSQKGIQVLNTFIKPELFLPFNNGWPDWCCYQIDIVFQTLNNNVGTFEQNIVFDFKTDPKLAKRLSVLIEPPDFKLSTSSSSFEDIVDKLHVVATNPNSIQDSASSESDSTSSDEIDGEDKDEAKTNNHFPSLLTNSESLFSLKNLNCSNFQATITSPIESVHFHNRSPDRDYDSGGLLRQWVNQSQINQTKFVASENQGQVMRDVNQELGVPRQDNYVSWMNNFLSLEIKARQAELTKLSVKSDIAIFNSLNSSLGTSLPIGLFGKLFFKKDINEDSKIGRLISSSCRSISIGEVEGSVIGKPRTYICRVINKSEHAIVILIGRDAVEELNLSHGITRKLDIWLHLEHSNLDLLKSSLQGLTEHHLKLLFPDFPESQLWDFNSVIGNSTLRHDSADETLNTKQREGMHTIMESSADNSSSLFRSVPILVMGPSGSGKSYLLARSIMSIITSLKLSKFGSRILICTYTNKAADEYVFQHFHPWLTKQSGSVEEPTLLRIYHVDHIVENISLAVKPYCLRANDETSFRYPSVNEVLSYKIVVVTISTCLELLQLGLPDYVFSHIFIDESERMLEIEALCPLVLAGRNTKVILAGDSKLLDPEVFALELLQKYKETTLIDRLQNLYPQRHPFRIRLEDTYNNNKDIVQFVSNEFYSSSLKCPQSHSQPMHSKYYPLAFSIVQGGEESQPDHGEGYYNMNEIYEIRDRIIELVRAWPTSWSSPKDGSIAVITPYADQALGLRIKLKLEGLSFVDVKTLPNVLTKLYRVVLISPVRTFGEEQSENLKCISEDDGGFFTNSKAIYTAMTRAQSLFMVVGDLVGLCNVGCCKDIWRQYVNICRQNNSLLGLPGLSEKHSKSTAISRPIKKSELYDSSPALDSRIVVKKPVPLPLHTNTNVGDKPAVQERKNLSSIWNTPDASPSLNYLNDSSGIHPHSSIWDDSPRTGTLGNLADPTSIWSANSTNSGNSFTQQPNHNIGSNSRIGYDEANMSVSEKLSLLVDNNLPSAEEDGSYKSPFDLPDVRLLAEAALGTRDLSSYNSSSPMIPPPTVPPYKSVLQNIQAPLPNYQSSYTNHNVAPLVSANSLFVPSSCTKNIRSTNSNLSWTNISKPSNIAPTMPAGSQPVYRNCTSFEIAQANYAYYHGVPRRLGYTPPPRMLRNYRPLVQMNTSTIPTRVSGFENFNSSGFVKETPKKFDFIKELGLDSGKIEKCGSLSSSSSQTSNNEQVLEDVGKLVLDSKEFPDLNNTDWIEVKSSKKQKNTSQRQQQKKGKRKSKSECDIGVEVDKEMSVDQKIESLKEMGFDKRQAIKALQVCDKDLERAVEWLIQFSSVVL